MPSQLVLRWHQNPLYGFLHFTVITFTDTDKEWCYGDEKPDLFTLTVFDLMEIVNAAKHALMTGLILTCKHHD